MSKAVEVKVWSGQLVDGAIRRKFLFMRQIQYTRSTRATYSEPYVSSQRIKWFPIWRVFEVSPEQKDK